MQVCPLNEIRLKRVFKQSGHSTNRLEITRGNRLVVICVCNDNFGESFLEICNRACKTEYSHDLGCNGNIEAILAGSTIDSSTKSVNYKSELTVIHINASLPSDLLDVNAKAVALLNMVVKHCCKQIVCRTDCVKIAGEVQVDILHGNNLSVSAACGTALYSENRAERRLAESNRTFLTDSCKTICKAYRGGSFTFACRGRIDGGNKHKLAVCPVAILEQIVIYLCLILAVLLDIFIGDVKLCRNFIYIFHFALLCNFYVC